MKIIKDSAVVEDNWTLIEKGCAFDPESLPAEKSILPAGFLLKLLKTGLPLTAHYAVWLDSDETPEILQNALGNELNRLPLVAIHFPVFSDGRGYSYAQILRQDLQYTGEIRAVGDILVDQLFFMRRCGFNAFVLRDPEQIKAAEQAFETFKYCYQAASDQRQPIIGKR